MNLNTIDCRCDCGALIARRTAVGLELKCRRCKRVWSIGIDDFRWTESRPEALAPGATT